MVRSTVYLQRRQRSLFVLLVMLFMLMVMSLQNTLAQTPSSPAVATRTTASNAIISTATALASPLETNELILFISDRSGPIETYLMNSDGSNQRLLTAHMGPIRGYEAVFSPDRSQIAFVSHSEDSQSERIFLVNIGGTELTWLISEPTSDIYITWVPSGNQIGFTSARGEGTDIYVMDLDGRGVTLLTSADGSHNFDPVWSPNGEKIAFLSTRDDKQNVYIMNSDGSNVKQITSGENLYRRAFTWSPDSTSLVFVSARDGRENLYKMSMNGDEVEQLTYRGENSHPAWSPDGTKIAFISTREESPALYTMNADGTGLKQLISDFYMNYSCPMWTPDSQKIVVMGGPNLPLYPHPLYDIYIVNADGSNLLTLTDDLGTETVTDCVSLFG